MDQLLEFITEKSLLDINPEIIEQCGLEGVNFSEKSTQQWLELAEKEIRKFPYNTVSTCWFAFYTSLRIIEATTEFSLYKDCDDHSSESCERSISKAIKCLDYAYIIADNTGRQQECPQILKLLDLVVEQKLDYRRYDPDRSRPVKRRKLSSEIQHETNVNLPTQCVRLPTITKPVRQVRVPPLHQFEKLRSESEEPILLDGTLEHWPALERWRSCEYWLKRTLGGRRYVPIEIGQSYTDDDWRQEILPFKQFLETYIVNADTAEDVGYLAQHDLLRQIPDLRKDITIPDYCYCEKSPSSVFEGPMRNVPEVKETSTQDIDSYSPVSLSAGDGSGMSSAEELEASLQNLNGPSSPVDEVNIQEKVWIGGRTVSPLHHDPYDNILCQVHGTKYVRLYSPRCISQLYPRSKKEPAPHVNTNSPSNDAGGQEHTIDMSNNSQVDIYAMELSPMEDWDEKWPGISDIPYVECLLTPGQALFIPKGWWHYVRACSVCISVSFWW